MDTMQRIKDLAVSDSGFLFDPLSGSTFTVNQTGRTILEGLKAGSGRDGIVAQLADTFAVHEAADLHRDVDEFTHLLRQCDLLPPDFEL